MAFPVRYNYNNREPFTFAGSSALLEMVQAADAAQSRKPSAAGLRNWRMCGLFTLRLPPKELAGILGLFREPDSGKVISWRSVNP